MAARTAVFLIFDTRTKNNIFYKFTCDRDLSHKKQQEKYERNNQGNKKTNKATVTDAGAYNRIGDFFGVLFNDVAFTVRIFIQ